MNDMPMMDQTAAGDNLRGNSAGRRQLRRPSIRDILIGRGGRSSRSSSSRSSRSSTPGISSTRDKIPKGFSLGQLNQFTPEQYKLYERMFNQVKPRSYLNRLASGDERYFEEMEEPAWRTLQEAQGQLGSRYAQLAPGALSAKNGSGFQNAANQQTSDFAMNLASKRRDLQRQAIADLMGVSNSLLSQRPLDRSLIENAPKQEKKALGGFGGVAGGVLGGIGGGLFGGPGGALAGASIGSRAFGGL